MEIGTILFDDPFIEGMDPKNKKYIGQIKDGKACGIGRCQIFGSGCHVGNWLHGKMNGYGRCIYGYGNSYEGFIVGGERNGYGKYE